MLSIKDHTQLIFANEKPMKEIDIFGTVKRNVVTYEVPNHSMNKNSKTVQYVNISYLKER